MVIQTEDNKEEEEVEIDLNSVEGFKYEII